MVDKKGTDALAVKSKAPRKKRQWLSAENRKRQIIASAQKVFVRLGLNGTRTQDLAKEAGVNEATLFLYFKNKREIFEASVLEPLSELVKVLMDQGKGFSLAADAGSRELIGSDAHKSIFESIQKVGPLLSTAVFADEKMGKEIYTKEMYPLIKIFSEAASVSFDLKDDQDGAEFVVIAALGLSFLMQTHYRLIGVEPDVDAVAERIAHLFLQGV